MVYCLTQVLILKTVQTDEDDEVIKRYLEEYGNRVSSDEAYHRGGKKHSKREVLGKTMIIYKIQGDRKEYVKHKGKLITIKDYKALMKKKSKAKEKAAKEKMSTYFIVDLKLSRNVG